MTSLLLETAGAFVAGAGCALAALAVFGPRFVRWYMRRQFKAALSEASPPPAS